MRNIITLRPQHIATPSYPFKVLRRKRAEPEYLVYRCRGCDALVAEQYYGITCAHCRTHDDWETLYVTKEVYERAGTNEL